jgi:TolA-binding protein
VLGAGEAWSPPPPQAVAVPTSSTPAPSAPVPAKPSPAARGLNSSLRSVDTQLPDPSADFRAATAAFNGGDNVNAAARFNAFVTAHPRDPRAQDAAYLRILALQRSGNSAAMQQAARNYLSRYPGAFRRAEVEALAGISPVDSKPILP